MSCLRKDDFVYEVVILRPTAQVPERTEPKLPTKKAFQFGDAAVLLQFLHDTRWRPAVEMEVLDSQSYLLSLKYDKIRKHHIDLIGQENGH